MDSTSRWSVTFAALILAQAVHSVEEYVGRLWESFPPARFVSSLVSSDLERGFLIVNVLLVTFGVWAYVWPVRRQWRSAASIAWFWVAIELINGVEHPLWAVRERGYAPGVATAPFLFALALYLAVQLRRLPRRTAAAC